MRKANGGGTVRDRANCVAAVASFILLAISPAFAGEPGIPPSPRDLWIPPRSLRMEAPPPTEEFPLPADIAERIRDLTLTDLIDMALLASPRTRASWYAARSAREALSAEKGDYYPQLDLEVAANRVHGSAVGGRFSFDQKNITPSLGLTWTLFDFGKRGALVEERRQELIAANWSHNAMVQGIVLEVQQAYYHYLNARALVAAEEVAMRDARISLEAAEFRHRAGVATIADVLQSKTSLSQSELALETRRGQIQIVRGIIATSLGISPTSDFDVKGELPEELPLEQISENIDSLIALAHAQRPDLSSMRALAAQAEAHVRNVKREGWPVLELGGNLERVYYYDPDFTSDNYSVGLFLRFPLFTGFRNMHEVHQSREDLEVSRAGITDLEQRVSLEVWTSYYLMKTASELIQTSRDLLASAQQSYEVALGRYRAGVGSILEVLPAQVALEDARAESIRAKTEWLLSVAKLERDIGALGASGLLNPSPEERR
jgi:outer membrane protein TolC